MLPVLARLGTGPRLLAFHDQDLVDFMTELELCKYPRARFAFHLAQGGHTRPLSEKESKRLRKETGSAYGSSVNDSPILSGLEGLLFALLLSALQMETELKLDIGGQNHFRFAPSRGSPELNANAVMRLLDNIGNPGFCEPGAVIHMQSPCFDKHRRGSVNWEQHGFLGQSNLQMIIAPASEVFELEDYEYHL
ncbi:hypothetical protein EJ02DRAFT_487001 [Clathrospora elynae]|uniref:Uncharacterized protein n=1 Tax=Clathrospora elynae TaxID=706981 RepID=A0A6A5STW0_9PLEO|nr:hypothetical protein EJ02DRAFT_487001 [Clathrospora elynae]